VAVDALGPHLVRGISFEAWHPVDPGALAAAATGFHESDPLGKDPVRRTFPAQSFTITSFSAAVSVNDAGCGRGGTPVAGDGRTVSRP
jgi:hypothetical protein